MPRKKPDAVYLRDMLDAGRAVGRMIADATFQTYAANEQMRLAVERAVMIVGEAASHVSPEFRASTPDIPWSKIIRQRHRLVHDYDDVDDVLIWRVAAVHVPVLVAQLEPLVPPPPPDPPEST